MAFKIAGTFPKHNPLYENIIQSDIIIQCNNHCVNNHGKLINVNAKMILEYSNFLLSWNLDTLKENNSVAL